MPPKAYLSPNLVHQTCEELLEEVDSQGRPSVTLEDVVERLYQKGVRNPRTRNRPSRQAVLNLLTAPGNVTGQRLHARLVGTTTLAGRVQAVN
jgi:hypothetical protein